MSVAVDQLHRLRGLGRHDRALTSSLAPPGGSTKRGELERLLGKKPMEIAILQAAQEEVVKKSPRLRKGSGR